MFWQHLVQVTQAKPLENNYFFSVCDDRNLPMLFLQTADTVLAHPQSVIHHTAPLEAEITAG